MRRSETGGRSAGVVFAYFNKRYLKLHPEMQREFTKPKGVKTSYVNGKEEYFTETSPMPARKENKSSDENIVF